MPERNQAAAQFRSYVGEQGLLVITSVPAAADPRLVGQNLVGAPITVAGTYTCVVPVNGMRVICEVDLTATLTGMTVTSDIYTTYNDESTKKTSFAGVGLLVTATRQVSTFAPKGERRAIVSLVVGGAGSVAFTQGEYAGL